MKKLLTFPALCFVICSYGQNHEVDSIRRYVATEKEDSNKINNLCELATRYSDVGKADSALAYANAGMELAQKLKITAYLGYANQTEGEVYQRSDDYIKALPYLEKGKGYLEQTGRKASLARLVEDIGNNYLRQGDFPKALDNMLQELKIAEELGKDRQLATAYSDMGNVYYYMKDYDKAIEMDSKTLAIREKQGNKFQIAFSLCNLGSMYTGKEDYTKSLDCYLKALDLARQVKAQQIIIYCIGNLGGIYYKLGQYDKALEYDQQAKQLGTDIGDKSFVALTDDNIGEVLTKMKKYPEGETMLKEALNIDSTDGDIEGQRNAYNTLAGLYADSKQWENAYHTYRRYTIAQDSLVSQDKSKEIGKLEARADYDKQLAIQKANEDKKNALSEAENKRQKIVIAFVGLFALGLGLVAIIIFRALSVTRKQKTTIEQQKSEVEVQKTEVEKQKLIVEEKNRDILDSITYAKRLQEAILPPLTVIRNYLPESFILYKPKDIVAGDFYWMEREGDIVLIAACDCTGHGVPGALVSVVCSNALNRALKEFKLRSTSKILDKVSELVVETFAQSEGTVMDGMDASFCAINTKTGEVEWSGAYNPLWYVQKDEMKELAANKRPIGKYEGNEPFSSHHLKLAKDDTLYLFTDGYADQFGGLKGKKFKYKQLQELLLKNATKPMDEQYKILNATLETWKGNLEQVDDVLVIGIRL